MGNSIFDVRTSTSYPENVYVDANIIIKIYQGYGNDYEKFIINAVRNGSILIYSPVVLAWETARPIIVNHNSIEAYMPSGQELETISNSLIAQYGLGIGDAEHLVVMNHNHTNSILTDDGGFSGIDGLNIYSKSYSALKNGASSGNSIIPFNPFI